MSQMNKLVASVQDGKKNVMLRKAFQDAMDGWAAKDDKFEYKNQEDNSVWRQINAFLSAGRKDDLIAMVAPDVDSMTREQLEVIAKTTQPDFSSMGDQTDTTGWKDTNGKYLTDTEKGT